VTTKFAMRLHPGPDDDVIAWLANQVDKTAAVKRLIRANIRAEVAAQTGSGQVDLAAIRRVVEAAIADKLAGVALSPTGAGVDADPELENKLDEMF